jgi:uncharacterized protein DUF6962
VRLALVGTAVERTTAATDALLALAALAAASALGAIIHGLAMSDGLRDLLWQPLYLLLGVTMSLFVVGAVGARLLWGHPSRGR